MVNGIAAKDYDIKAYAQDPFSLQQRTKYAEGIMRDMMAQQYLDAIKQETGLNLYNSQNPESLPQSKEELEIYNI